MDPWQVGLSVASIVIPSLIAIAIAIVVFKKQTPKRELWWELTHDSLTPDAPTGLAGRLGVSIDGAEVADPYIARLRFWSTGKSDVESSAFDQGKAIMFELDSSLVKQYETPVVTGLDPQAVRLDGARVLIEPTLLRHDCAVELRLITSGRPDVVERSSIVDVRVRRMTGKLEDLSGALDTGPLAFMLPVFALLLAVSATVPSLQIEDPKAFAPYQWVLLGLSMVTAIGYAVYSTKAFVRAVRGYRSAQLRARVRLLKQLMRTDSVSQPS